MNALTYHNKPELKAQILAGYDAHIKADTLIKGEYFNYDDGFKGCHIGCVVRELGGDEVDQYSDLTGLPVWLRDLTEHFFERMAYPENQRVSRAILEAVPVGQDITPVYHKFMVWLLEDEKHGTLQYCDERGAAATQAVINLHKRSADGIEVDNAAWAAARAAAWAAARAAWAAARDAEAAAGAAAWAAAWAADAAAGAAAWDAAWDAQSKKLIQLLSESE